MRIAIIAPLESIAHTAHEVLANPKFNWQADFDIVHGDLEAGLEQAYRAVERGAEVIISRGGTASYIASHIQIPVVEIQVTVFDILQALQCINTISGVVGVVFTRRLLFECEKLGNMIGIPMREYFIENELVRQEIINGAIRDGIETFLGDASSVNLLKQQGLKVYPIESGTDAVAKAVHEAVCLAGVRRKEREKAELFRTIIDSSAEGIVAIDSKGHVTTFNPTAEQIFQIPSSSAVGKYIGELVPDDKLRGCLTGDKCDNEDVKLIGDRVYAIKRIPIKLNGEVVGAIANLQDVTQLQRFEQVVRQKLNKKGLVAKFHLEQLIGSSRALELVKERARQYSATDTTVLITGESGTGKELMAQSIHNLSNRKNGPFVAVNCAALPENLLESELFGYEEGAFTGAKKGGKPGLFELAHGGTIFLDEIGEIPLALQARLLRVLQEKEVMRLGGDKVIPIDVRVLSATNQELMKLVEKKEFRADLYYRLDVLRLHIPPLRERREDIPELVRHFVKKYSGKKIGLTDEAIWLMQRYPWYGNIRELENVVKRLALLVRESMIEAEDVRQELAGCEFLADSESGRTSDSLDVWEKQKIDEILLEEKYNYTRAAKRLGVSRTTLWRKMKEWEKMN
ncbi:Anaerobic nitric oxide reductase transcription regulator NorR [Sporomusa carbonis]|uniref:sigma 54-interacting transcriptional regulator n=1 Tax=Sporomusa carbonis TaxID=3076075 RepID=UPI003A609BA5